MYYMSHHDDTIRRTVCRILTDLIAMLCLS